MTFMHLFIAPLGALFRQVRISNPSGINKGSHELSHSLAILRANPIEPWTSFHVIKE